MRAPALFGLAVLSSGCGSDPASAPSDPSVPRPEVVAEAIGRGDGSPGSVELTVVYEPVVRRLPTSLAFNSARARELWVVLQEEPVEELCVETAPVQSVCATLEGRVAIVTNAQGSAPVVEEKKDFNAWHFMRRPMQIAFGTGGLFATCGEARTANYEDADVPYNGPTLWDSDPALFGVRPGAGMNGTHLDMLHETPYCMGIAHERGNVYWAFNGDVGALDRYDFHEPHAPGGEDHSDGELWRYAEGELSRVPGVPSQLAYDPKRGVVYVADSGNARVVAVDPSTARQDGDVDTYDPIQTHARMSGAEVSEVLPPGVLELPSGLTLRNGVLFVTDRASSRVVAILPDGAVLRELDTGLPENSLAGIAIGPDGKAYLTDLGTGRVLRVDPL